MKNINVSDLQSVLMTTSFPGSSTLSSMPISVQLDIVSSSSESNQILEINNDLTDRPQIVTDLSNRLLTSHNTEYSNGQISVYHSTVPTESTEYYQISSEDTLMISTVYPLRNHVSITDTGLNGTKETTHDEQTLASVYSLEKTMLSTVYQSESSFIPSVTSFIDLAPSSSFETIRQYSTLDNAYHSMNYIHDDSEPGHHAGTEETTDVKDIVVKTNEKEIKIEININNNIVQEERKSTTITTTTTTQQPPQMPLELMVICAYMCQQRGSPIPPFCGCTLQAWLR
ncbi:uncharacterized protein LOC117316513 [Pecten maximus]|uniref:uncharacterized protein LOC117316513 n=1 Tax=Pecten maximus TaxID=6579 RepID=UPI001458B7AB|nr:uncharacterized protein LOC117316513 [Pecten maximus]